MVARAPAAVDPGRDFVLITCEHGGNRIPPELATHFRGLAGVLDTHRGYDPGALAMARAIARRLRAPLVASTVSRLVIDLNRTLGNPRAWSATTRALPVALRRRIVQRHYTPHWRRVEAIVDPAVAAGWRVIHIAAHSFTPDLDGNVRTADVGLLYDPARPGEASFAAAWKDALVAASPGLRVRRNYPYAGKGDGLTRALRRRFPAARYVGIELEVNQALALANDIRARTARGAVVATLHALVAPKIRNTTSRSRR